MKTTQLILGIIILGSAMIVPMVSLYMGETTKTAPNIFLILAAMILGFGMMSTSVINEDVGHNQTITISKPINYNGKWFTIEEMDKLHPDWRKSLSGNSGGISKDNPVYIIER